MYSNPAGSLAFVPFDIEKKGGEENNKTPCTVISFFFAGLGRLSARWLAGCSSPSGTSSGWASTRLWRTCTSSPTTTRTRTWLQGDYGDDRDGDDDHYSIVLITMFMMVSDDDKDGYIATRYNKLLFEAMNSSTLYLFQGVHLWISSRNTLSIFPSFRLRACIIEHVVLPRKFLEGTLLNIIS